MTNNKEGIEGQCWKSLNYLILHDTPAGESYKNIPLDQRRMISLGTLRACYLAAHGRQGAIEDIISVLQSDQAEEKLLCYLKSDENSEEMNILINQLDVQKEELDQSQQRYAALEQATINLQKKLEAALNTIKALESKTVIEKQEDVSKTVIPIRKLFGRKQKNIRLQTEDKNQITAYISYLTEHGYKEDQIAAVLHLLEKNISLATIKKSVAPGIAAENIYKLAIYYKKQETSYEKSSIN